jgi:hypothetical protein
MAVVLRIIVCGPTFQYVPFREQLFVIRSVFTIIHLHNRPFAQIVYARVIPAAASKVGFDTVLLPLIFRQ